MNAYYKHILIFSFLLMCAEASLADDLPLAGGTQTPLPGMTVTQVQQDPAQQLVNTMNTLQTVIQTTQTAAIATAPTTSTIQASTTTVAPAPALVPATPTSTIQTSPDVATTAPATTTSTSIVQAPLAPAPIELAPVISTSTLQASTTTVAAASAPTSSTSSVQASETTAASASVQPLMDWAFLQMIRANIPDPIEAYYFLYYINNGDLSPSRCWDLIRMLYGPTGSTNIGSLPPSTAPEILGD